MEFKFRRKYTFFFFGALLLHIAALYTWLFTDESSFGSLEHKKIICLLIVLNIELTLILYLGLFRKKYHAYYDKISIKRAFFPTKVISYKDIITIKERPNDSILLGFGIRPSFTIYYANKRRKKYTIRSDNNELLLRVIKNEIEITKKQK